MICPLAWAALLFKWVPQKIHNGRSKNLYKALVTLSGKHPDTDFVGSLVKPRRGLLPETNLITDLSGNAWRRNLTYELQALGPLQISRRLTV